MNFFRKLRLRFALRQLDREQAVVKRRFADSEIGYGELADLLNEIDKRREILKRALEVAK